MKIINKKKIIIVSLILLAIILLNFTGAYEILSLENFIKNREYFLMAVNENYFLSLVIYSIAYVLVVVSTIPLGGPMTSIGGFLFGTVYGTIYATIAGTIGSALSFLAFRYFLGRFVQEKYGKKFEKFNKNIDKYGIFYIFIIQLIGLIPFFVVNILASFTKISIYSFMVGTFIAIIPTNFLYSYAGRKLGTINSFSELFSGKVSLIFLLLGLFFLISILVKKYKKVK